MRYLCTIYGDETELASATPDQLSEIMKAYGTFTREVSDAGVMLGGDGLQPTSTATTVRVRDGERLLTDGPFAETKEQLAGFYMLECENLDEAIEWASKIPGAAIGSVEVRPVMDYEGADESGAEQSAAAQS
ncbi:MAG: hypothetical protein QOI32_1392 [Thermoleophilaceae bacterium]|jgi:hypothetical protein|nr:hypothetical protein [Thermoleophilaceae bacterium]